MTKPDEQAFPHSFVYDETVGKGPDKIVEKSGLTKREWFATHAPSDVLERNAPSIPEAETELGISHNSWNPIKHWPQLMAKRSVEWADALLAALEKHIVQLEHDAFQCTNGGHKMNSDGSCLCGHFKPFQRSTASEGNKVTNDEINEAVARKLGLITLPCTCDPYAEKPHLKPYSTSIEAAWEIVEKLINDQCTVSLNMTWRFGKPAYQCEIYVGGKGEIASTAPMAICKAFLKLAEGDGQSLLEDPAR